MVQLTYQQIRVIDDAFEMHQGYVLNFSDRTIAEFFYDEFSIDLAAAKYRVNGDSKAKRLRTLIKLENESTVVRILRKLWEYKISIPPTTFPGNQATAEKDVKTPLFNLIAEIEGSNTHPRTDALHHFTPDETLEELIAAIERDIQANKPAAALDRLHTYCMKKFSYLLEKHNTACAKNDPLHSRVGKYANLLEDNHDLKEISKRIIKTSISIFEQFNHIRNNQTFAHDNDLIEKAEARFIFDGITAILRFIKTIEAERFGS